MDDQSTEYWFYIALAVLALAWVLNVWVPVLLMKPVWQGTQQFLELDDAEADTPSLPPPPSLLLPLGAVLAALVAMVLGVRHMHVEQHVGGRWLWVTAAAVVAFLWAIIVMVVTFRSTAGYAQQLLSALWYSGSHAVLFSGVYQITGFGLLVSKMCYTYYRQ